MINYLCLHFLDLASCMITASVLIDLDSFIKSNVHGGTNGH